MLLWAYNMSSKFALQSIDLVYFNKLKLFGLLVLFYKLPVPCPQPQPENGTEKNYIISYQRHEPETFK